MNSKALTFGFYLMAVAFLASYWIVSLNSEWNPVYGHLGILGCISLSLSIGVWIGDRWSKPKR